MRDTPTSSASSSTAQPAADVAEPALGGTPYQDFPVPLPQL